MSVRKHLENFAQNTSMHGLGKVILTKKPEKRVAWVIVFVAAWALFAFQLTRVLTQYFEYPKKTTTEFVSGGAPFPAITLCNMQSLDFYAVHKFLKEYQISKTELFGTMSRSRPDFIHHFKVLLNVLDKYIDSNKVHKSKWSQSDWSELYAIFSRTSFPANLPKDTLDEIVLKQQEFIVKCTYGNSNCSFTEIPDSYFLKCFTFEPPNIRSMSFEDFQSLSEGIANGFSVTVFTGIKSTENDTKNWIPGGYEKDSPLSGSSGIRVVVHPPGTEPFPLTEGYDVPPGHQASIGIIPERRKRLGKPYGLCARKNRYKNNILDQLRGVGNVEHEPYRKISCERTCMQEQVIKECKCFDETLPDMGNASRNDDVRWLMDRYDTRVSYIKTEKIVGCRSIPSAEKCALDASCNASMVDETLKNIRCANKVIKRLMTDLGSLSKCNCYAPCDEFRYHVSYSLAKWPSSGYENGFVHDDIFRDENFTNRFAKDKREIYEEYREMSGMEFMNDFAKINVYITDSNILQIVEEEAMTFTQLISDVGGQLGIWIGVSVITISEVLETVLKIATAQFRQLYRDFKVRKTDSDNNVSTKPDLEENKLQNGPNEI